ncbi:hypothetical protein ABPG74_011350 [Tetrahymena malaccensis]
MSDNQFSNFEQNQHQNTEECNLHETPNQQEQEIHKSAKKEELNSKIELESPTTCYSDQSTDSSTDKKTQSSNKDDDALNGKSPSNEEIQNVKISILTENSIEILGLSWHYARVGVKNYQIEFTQQAPFVQKDNNVELTKQGTCVHKYYEQLNKLLSDLAWVGESYHQFVDNPNSKQYEEKLENLLNAIQQIKENNIFSIFNKMNEDIKRDCNLQDQELKWILFVYFQLYLHYKSKNLIKRYVEKEFPFSGTKKKIDLIFYDEKKTEFIIIDFKYSKLPNDQILKNYYKTNKKKNQNNFIDQIKAVKQLYQQANVKLVIFPIKSQEISNQDYKEYDLNELEDHLTQYFQDKTNNIQSFTKKIKKEKKD